MSRVRSRDTKIELRVRKALFHLGYRYRVNFAAMPGKPDIAFPGRKKAVFVNGCLWHGHDCRRYKTPKTNVDFWRAKIETNIKRDKANLRDLEALGWKAMTIWECELRSFDDVIDRVVSFLETT